MIFQVASHKNSCCTELFLVGFIWRPDFPTTMLPLVALACGEALEGVLLIADGLPSRVCVGVAVETEPFVTVATIGEDFVINLRTDVFPDFEATVTVEILLLAAVTLKVAAAYVIGPAAPLGDFTAAFIAICAVVDRHESCAILVVVIISAPGFKEDSFEAHEAAKTVVGVPTIDGVDAFMDVAA